MVEISDEARAGWRQHAEVEGVTVTGLVEAIGLAAARPGLLPKKLVSEARRLDAERRRRDRTA